MAHDHTDDFLRLAAEAKSRIREVDPDEAMRLVKEGAVLLDVREKDEFEEGHLVGSVHLSRGLLEMKVGEIVPDKESPIVCYCAGGNRGALAADTLRSMGYTGIVSIQGGMKACRINGSGDQPEDL